MTLINRSRKDKHKIDMDIANLCTEDHNKIITVVVLEMIWRLRGQLKYRDPVVRIQSQNSIIDAIIIAK
jgi:hypothetical protein